MTNLIEVIKEEIELYLDEKDLIVQPESGLLNDLNLSSFDSLLVITNIEDRLGIQLSHEELIKVRTVEDLLVIISKK